MHQSDNFPFFSGYRNTDEKLRQKYSLIFYVRFIKYKELFCRYFLMAFVRIDLRRSAEYKEDFGRKLLKDWLSKCLKSNCYFSHIFWYIRISNRSGNRCMLRQNNEFPFENIIEMFFGNLFFYRRSSIQ